MQKNPVGIIKIIEYPNKHIICIVVGGFKIFVKKVYAKGAPKTKENVRTNEMKKL